MTCTTNREKNGSDSINDETVAESEFFELKSRGKHIRKTQWESEPRAGTIRDKRHKRGGGKWHTEVYTVEK